MPDFPLTLPLWPIDRSNLDQGSDKPFTARLQLLTAIDWINQAGASYGNANGIASLDPSGHHPQSHYNAQAIMNVLVSSTLMGHNNSGFDADLLDGKHGAEYVTVDGLHAINTTSAQGQVVFRSTGFNTIRSRALTIQAKPTPGAAAAGFGVELRAQLADSAGFLKDAGYIGWEWTVATAGSEDADVILGARSNGVLAEVFRVKDTKQLELVEITDPGVNAPSGKTWLYATATGLAVRRSSGGQVILGAGGGGSDHGTLTGLTDDDHPQYLRTDGSRSTTGELQLGGFALRTTDLGADPAAPSAGNVKFYSKAGQLYYRNSASVVGPIITGGVTSHAALTGLANNDHPQYLLVQPTANVVINAAGGDFDFQIQGDSAFQLFNIDAGFDQVCINGSGTSGGGFLHITSTTTRRCAQLEHTGAADVLSINKTGGTPPTGALYITNTTPGKNARFERTAGSDAGSTAVVEIVDTHPSLGGTCLYLLQAGTAKNVLRADTLAGEVFSVRAGELVINDGGIDFDVRMESDDIANMFVLNADNNTISIGGDFTDGRFNVAPGGVAGLLATAHIAADANVTWALTIDCTGGAFGLRVLSSSANGFGGGALIGALRTTALTVTKDLGGFAAAGGAGVLVTVASISDDADALYLNQKGAGDIIHGANDVTEVFRFPVGGGLSMKERPSNMADIGAGNWGLYFKSDGLYIIKGVGQVVTGPLGTGGGGGSGGGIVTSANNAERRPDHFEELVSVQSGNIQQTTGNVVPAGAITERVLTRVVTPFSGGFHCGVGSDPQRYGGNLTSASAGATNLLDQTWPADHPNYSPQAIQLTSASGAPWTTSGQVRVTVFFRRYTAATT